MALLDLWHNSPEQLRDKKVHQIIAFAGDGKLLDESICSQEFRNFLGTVPSECLQKYSEQCLAEKFDNSGLALQDIVNEVGNRLGAKVQNGRYRGTQSQIGFDGFWNFPKGNAIIVEVKTTDVYTINLNTCAKYRKELITQQRTTEEQSSILIVVGKQETENLEAQIRGSIHAWSIRVISVKALFRLLAIKQELEDQNLVKRIHALLVPHEFTKLDEIAELLFSTANEIRNEDETIPSETDQELPTDAASTPTFREECIDRVQTKLKISLVKQTRAGYTTPDEAFAVICATSKEYNSDTSAPSYWFAFHPHQREFLEPFPSKYVVFGCGNKSNILLVPYEEVLSWLSDSWTTTSANRTYWHVVIERNSSSYILKLRKGIAPIDLTQYAI